MGVAEVIPSPILGPEGNREFLLHLVAGSGARAADRLRDERLAEVTAR